nr:2-oxo acid dehydrogenase subunit E2 [Actinomycetota bacterium]
VGQRAAQVAGGVPVLAKPPVRKLARDLGVDLTSVLGTGPHGSISRADVEAAAAPPPRLAEDGVRRVPVRGVRRATAAAMVRSAFTAPHVTEFLTVDVTATLELRDRLAARPDAAGVRLSPLVFTARALLLALRRTPEMNSSWDDDAGEIVVFERVHLGIAAATPRGLLVPNVKDAQRLDLLGLARALTALTEQARSGRTPPADLTDGTITITNVGALGVDTGTPILNPGEAAVLCLGAVRPMPWVHEGQLAVRQVVQLAVSFDHRVVDGHEASRFLADVGAVLHDPALALAWC